MTRSIRSWGTIAGCRQRGIVRALTCVTSISHPLHRAPMPPSALVIPGSQLPLAVSVRGGNAVVAQGADDSLLEIRCVPRPVPTPHALFETGDDLVGGAAVKVGAGW